MKEIVVISGKGGTGKTSITASFAELGGKEVIVADCDVDAADMHLLLKPDFEYEDDFFSGEEPRINQPECISCGRCEEVCKFDAIIVNGRNFKVDTISCEGCGYCARVCPTSAIVNLNRNVGKIYISNIQTGSIMVHAKLGIGSDNSGKLVAHVISNAKDIAEEKRAKYIIVDGSPGIGCPVVSSISGASLAVIVTEPTLSGLHDLKRVFDLVSGFKIRTACIINKFDLNLQLTKEIEEFLKINNIEKISLLPYDQNFTRAISLGKTRVSYAADEVSELIKQGWNKIINIINNN